MEWTELILEHFVQIIHYIAWPAVALVSLFLFRKELGVLMGRIRKVARGNALVEFSDTDEQGETEKLPLPDLRTKTEEPTDLSKEATRILATIWQRQKHHFKDDFSKRWSFRVLPNAEGYGIFMLGFAELLKLALVGWTRKDGQALLTDKGVEYLKGHPEIQESDDVYRF